MWSSWNQALQARCLVSASAVALIMTSLNETFPRSPSCRLSASRASAARSMSTSLVRKKWGMGPSDVARRLAMVLRICVRGTSSYGAPPRTVGEMGEGRGVCGGTPGGAAAPRTSPFSLLPASSTTRFTPLPPRPPLGERVAGLHGVPFPLVPLHPAPLFHRGGERFHEDLGGHSQSRYSTRRAAATTLSGLGLARRSSCLL